MITLQLIGWGVILLTTIIWSFTSSANSFATLGMAHFMVNIISLLITFFLNYFIFIPRYLFKERRTMFVVANFILISTLVLCSSQLTGSELFDALRPVDFPRRPRYDFMSFIRDSVNCILMVGLVTAMRLSERLQKSEEALREAESARVKAELDNLRSQINPHFLLNTLNNIYALTSIDTVKAQKTIKELSDLLRYILYDNQCDKVPLSSEVDFLKSYIELMSIRLPRKVSLSTHFDISPNCTTQIAPMIFISLIENAFKHSVSASGEGFIEILFEDRVSEGQIILSIRNSNHAKAQEDKSGHGIGLEQVRRRLELLYAGHYSWEIEQDSDVYSSVLTLNNCI